MHALGTAVLLLTPRLRLEPCRPIDRADFAVLERDPEVMRFLNGGSPLDEAETAVASFLTPNGTETFVWTARSIADNQFIGWFSLRPDRESVAEPGYRLKRDAWGHGLASEGANAVVAWGCSSSHYNQIVAGTMAANLASRRVLENAGFVYRRTVYADHGTKIPGSEQGEAEYELICAAASAPDQ